MRIALPNEEFYFINILVLMLPKKKYNSLNSLAMIRVRVIVTSIKIT